MKKRIVEITEKDLDAVSFVAGAIGTIEGIVISDDQIPEQMKVLYSEKLNDFKEFWGKALKAESVEVQ